MSGHNGDIIGGNKRDDEKEEGSHKLPGKERWGLGRLLFSCKLSMPSNHEDLHLIPRTHILKVGQTPVGSEDGIGSSGIGIRAS